MASQVTLLGEIRVAVLANEESHFLVDPNMLLHVIQLCERLLARRALQHLVFALGMQVNLLQLAIAFSFADFLDLLDLMILKFLF